MRLLADVGLTIPTAGSGAVRRLPFVHGYADQLMGKGFLDNPYPDGSNDYRIWIDGYVKAMHRCD